MPTPPRPVPKDAVAARIRELCTWLADAGHVSRGAARDRRALELARDVLRGAARGALPARVAGWIVVLERYLAAESLHTEAARRKDLSTEAKDILYDSTVERETDATIRNLADRIAQIRRLLVAVGGRKEQRAKLTSGGERQDLVAALDEKRRADLGALLADLRAFDEAIEAFHANFHRFDDFRTVTPPTLAGWQELEDRIAADLVSAGYPWRKVARRRASSTRARATKQRG